MYAARGDVAASSYEALGITPGSVKVVRSKELIVKKYKTAPTIGIMGFMRVARNGQLLQPDTYMLTLLRESCGSWIGISESKSNVIPDEHFQQSKTVVQSIVICVHTDSRRDIGYDTIYDHARHADWMVSIQQDTRKGDPSLRLAAFLISLIIRVRLATVTYIRIAQPGFVYECQLQTISIEDMLIVVMCKTVKKISMDSAADDSDNYEIKQSLYVKRNVH
ncbi:hypothetical protein GQX74_003158 [Glossina fuscipes]|nr:hypothetical protein GQX74_003158 [Glossina fuscipes]